MKQAGRVVRFALAGKGEHTAIMPNPNVPLAKIDGWPVNTTNLDAAIDAILSAAKAAQPLTVFTLNLDHLVKLRSNEKFRDAYRSAGVVTADGAPVAWLARFQNAKVKRATGADMVVPLADAAAEARLPVFLFGSTSEVLTSAARRFGEQTDGLLDIAGICAPPFGFDPDGPEADAVIEGIRRSGAKICFVALGAPKQEIFAERARRSGVGCVMVCIGAALDFLAGAQTRAPKAVRSVGLEWAWRLVTNPRRLAKRYADCAALFASIVVLAPLRQFLVKPRTGN
jgi:exopolysaccharide biosynthesis WecB/TagA/CpsF family protein